MINILARQGAAHPVPGPRVNAKLTMWEAAERDVMPASHAYHPGFLVGQQSVAWEVWEQLGPARLTGSLCLWVRDCTCWASGTAVAALEVVLRQAAPAEMIVVPLTGSGLKGSPVL